MVLLDSDDVIRKEDSGCLGTYPAIFQAECYTIINGIENSFKDLSEDLTILTDNQALVQALAEPTTTSKTVHVVKDSLNTLGSKITIRVRWIMAHVGHFGNELTDLQAKKSLLFGPAPHIPLAKPIVNAAVMALMMETWSMRWRERKDARQSGIFFPMINLAKSEQLIRLPKEKLSTVVRALSGHDFRSRHTAVLEKQSPSHCSHCKDGEESPSHLILHCPRYIHYRAQIFGSYTKDIMHTWTASQVACFLSEPSISEEGKCTDDSNL